MARYTEFGTEMHLNQGAANEDAAVHEAAQRARAERHRRLRLALAWLGRAAAIGSAAWSLDRAVRAIGQPA